MRPLESGLRIERTATELVLVVSDRVGDRHTLERLVDMAELLAVDAPDRKLAAAAHTTSLGSRARLWMNIARIATIIALVAAVPGAAVPPISTIGNMISCGPGEIVGSRSTGAPRMTGATRTTGTTTLVCMTPKLEVTGDAGLWIFVVSFEIYFALFAMVIAAITLLRQRPPSARWRFLTPTRTRAA